MSNFHLHITLNTTHRRRREGGGNHRRRREGGGNHRRRREGGGQ